MNETQPNYQVNIGHQEKSNKKEVVFFAVSLIFFVGILLIYIFFFLNSKERQANKFVEIPRPDTEFYKLDPETKEITKTDEQPYEVVITDLELDGDTGGFRPEGMIVKGYFDSFDQNLDKLKFKNRLNAKSTNLQLLELDTSNINHFYCWPTTVHNSDVDIREVEIGLSSPTALVYHPDEQILPMSQMANFDMTDAFLIIQLEDEYDYTKTNFVKKLVVVDCKEL